MKFYVASSFTNIDSVRRVSEILKKRGLIHSYDWTQNDRASTVQQLVQFGLYEKHAVIESDILIVLLPAGKGSHVELGIALGHGKKVFLYSPTDEVIQFDKTSTFYHLPEVEIVIGTIDDLINTVLGGINNE